jgi:hypothetical protein
MITKEDETINEEGETAEVPSQASDIAQPDRMLFGKPVFRVDNELWHKIGFENRSKHGWREKFYGTPIGKWSKENKGKGFTLENEETGWLMDIERDRFNKLEREVKLDEETSRKCKNY